MFTRQKSICAFVGCVTNTKSNNSRSIRLFSFPNNPKTRQKWIDACNNPKVNPKTSVICDLHFLDDDYKSENLLLSDLLHTAVPKTTLYDPLEGSFEDYKCESKKSYLEFVDISGCIENEEIENISNYNKNYINLYKDSSVQCNLFEKIFNEEFENYSSDLKFSIDELSKLLGITRKKNLKHDLENEQIELFSDDSHNILKFNKNDDDFPSETNIIISNKKRKPPRDLTKQNFILLPNDDGYQCEICYKKCLNLAAYYAHHDSHLEHSTICTKCGLNSSSYKQALRHERVCTGQLLRNEKDNTKLHPQRDAKTCEICKHKFGKHVTYMDHMNVHYNIKPYTCSCSRKYSHYSNFLQHVIKFKCPMEGRIVPDYAPQGQAPQSTEIKEKYIENHNGEKRFYCPICDKQCYRRTYLKHFTEQEHLKNEKLWIEKYDIEKFRCIYCKVSGVFERLLDCINHCRKVHHKIPYNQIFQLFENKSIKTKKNLTKNIELKKNIDHKILINCTQIRSKQKYCLECDKYFVKRITFLDHMNIHDNTYPYICSCGARLRFYEEFLKHIRRNQCKGNIIFPDYAPQTFAKHYNSKNDIDNTKLENNLGIKKSNAVDNFEIENSIID